MSAGTDCRYVVVRQQPDCGRWTATLGLGGRTVGVPGSWESRTACIDAGTDAWRARVAAADIEAGDAPLPDDPIVLEPRPGQTAWDAASEAGVMPDLDSLGNWRKPRPPAPPPLLLEGM